MPRTTPKLLLVGWDAADWKMIRPLMEAGHMPALKSLVENGVSGNLTTLTPILSPMLWSSIGTGKRPFKHGVHGFVEPTPDGSAVRPVTSMTRKARAIWNILNLSGHRSHVVGWWPSHPAEPINGCMVSNQYQRAPKNPEAEWKMAPGTVHPERFAATLEELRLHPKELGPEDLLPFVPNAAKIDQSQDRRLDSLMRIIADCTSIQSAASWLLENAPWDFGAVYFDAIDHFGHGFMKYSPPRQPFVSEEDFEIYSNVVTMGYVYHDMMLARLIDLAGPQTTVMVVSDHGFHPDHLRPSALPMEPAGPAMEHREQGIFVVSGRGIRKGEVLEGASLLDVAPTILNFYGLPVGADMDGRVLTDIFETPRDVATIPSWEDVEGDAGRHSEDTPEDPDQAREMLKQLVDLGYVAPPSDDTAEEVRKTQAELDYNLALSYMDAEQHPAAADLLLRLYADSPLEFRYGLKLAICLQAMEQHAAMGAVVAHLNENWRKASAEARRRLQEIDKILKDRRALRDGAIAHDAEDELENAEAFADAVDEGEENGLPPQTKASTEQPIVAPHEAQIIRRLRAIARGNQQTLDQLAASAAFARKDFDTACDLLKAICEAGSTKPAAFVQLGNALFRKGKLDDAAEAMEMALSLDPDNAAAHLTLARAALRQKRDGDALFHAEQAVSLRYKMPAAHFFLGLAQWRNNELEKALRSIEYAVSLNPNFPEAHAILARIHGRVLKDQARAILHRAELRKIRQARRQASGDQPVLEMRNLEEVDLDKALPSWPQPPEHFVSPLAAPPRADASSRPSASGGDPVTIVSGLPRSGTSMAMQMLVAGGLEAMVDASRPADDSNPKGYLEYAPVKLLMQANDWLDEARGKVLKVVAPLIPALPQACDYRVVMMMRPPHEIAASQLRMLDRLDREGGKLDRDELIKGMTQHLRAAGVALEAHDVPILFLSYADVISNPHDAARRMTRFLDMDLDAQAMAERVDPTLWREKGVEATEV